MTIYMLAITKPKLYWLDSMYMTYAASLSLVFLKLSALKIFIQVHIKP